MKEQWYIRTAPSLGSFESTPEKIWGVKRYDPERHQDKPVVFWGLYGLPDFYALWRHKGRKAIFWCGSDLRHFNDGYWLDSIGKIRIDPEPLAKWIHSNCENWVENKLEQDLLSKWDIESTVCPSFLGDVKEFPVTYQWTKKPRIYSSVSGDDFKLYGWDRIPRLARDNPNIEFHLFGNVNHWETKEKNVFVHGRVSMDKMNKQIRNMQGALRLVEFEGFSEIVAKSLLWGQYPISVIRYPGILHLDQISYLSSKTRPNIIGRGWLLYRINRYPWNENL